MEPSSRNPASVAAACLSTWKPSTHLFLSWLCTIRSWFPVEWNSHHQYAMDYREEPWILIQ